MKPSFWIAVGAVFAFLSVAFGAFGAHALADRLHGRAGEIYHTAAQYQMYHALALVALGLYGGWQVEPGSSGLAQTAGWAFLAGNLIFSGSLYALALTDIKILGAITPIGGVGYLIGWACFVLLAVKT